jgi:hypothetical protein
MKVNVLPADIKEVRITAQRAHGYRVFRVTLPSVIVKRYDLKHGDTILLAYLCKSDQDIKELPE